MTPLSDINSNILIFDMTYSGGYQDESKNWDLFK